MSACAQDLWMCIWSIIAVLWSIWDSSQAGQVDHHNRMSVIVSHVRVYTSKVVIQVPVVRMVRQINVIRQVTVVMKVTVECR